MRNITVISLLAFIVAISLQGCAPVEESVANENSGAQDSIDDLVEKLGDKQDIDLKSTRSLLGSRSAPVRRLKVCGNKRSKYTRLGYYPLHSSKVRRAKQLSPLAMGASFGRPLPPDVIRRKGREFLRRVNGKMPAISSEATLRARLRSQAAGQGAVEAMTAGAMARGGLPTSLLQEDAPIHSVDPFAQISLGVISTFTSALVGLLVGTSATLAVLHFRRSASTADEALLA